MSREPQRGSGHGGWAEVPPAVTAAAACGISDAARSSSAAGKLQVEQEAGDGDAREDEPGAVAASTAASGLGVFLGGKMSGGGGGGQGFCLFVLGRANSKKKKAAEEQFSNPLILHFPYLPKRLPASRESAPHGEKTLLVGFFCA